MPKPPSLTPTRATPRQATSAVAHKAPPPAPDDPLLAFAPVPHKAPRRNSITADLQRAFIAHLAATGIVSEAARHIGKSMEALYKLRQRPGAEGFRQAWDAALDRGVARLEAGALARAIAGEERLVVSGGQVLGTEIRHNDALTMFFLRHRRPERYGAGALVPGHPAYEALKAELRAEWEEEKRAERQSPENREANIALLTRLREKWREQWEREREFQAGGVVGGGGGSDASLP
ncbi:hypothetical protein MACH24_24590 [Erythrobacter sp. Dej080120_24]|uniref:hypothetical protein n=1 Tax=Erythrobacter sp. Dej080120_24 TaxID=3024837 RepID=UPI00291F08BE|nr:hypothetical protein MACH24_24590 [Erythrobacter sp. Dej080120_24]